MGILTHEARQAIRQARSAHLIADRDDLIDVGRIQVCKGCGCDSDPDSLARTPGCTACESRRHYRTDERRREYVKARCRQRYRKEPPVPA